VPINSPPLSYPSSGIAYLTILNAGHLEINRNRLGTRSHVCVFLLLLFLSLFRSEIARAFAVSNYRHSAGIGLVTRDDERRTVYHSIIYKRRRLV